MCKFYCDRCGAEIKVSNTYWLSNKVIKARIKFAKNEDERGFEHEYEICPACQKEFNAWWEETANE